ncbi:MAG: ComF family protein [Lachnospiraceae bacterium]|nr:ComF family protein [Lachnospiraceae bacterium]
MLKSINVFMESLLEVLFPRRCFVCDRVIRKPLIMQGMKISACKTCFDNLSFIKEPVCSVCGRKVEAKESLCEECKLKKHVFISGKFPLSYECIARSVYRFKYNNRPFYAKDYATLIYLSYKDWIEYINPDAFIAVALHRKRLNKRGYNQAEELCRELSKLTKIPTRRGYVKRVVNTLPQKIFDRKHRQINVKKAFIVPKNDVKLKTVIVVDDIFTTGSTIDAISRELRHHGTDGIYFITITAAGT